jgi:hypothetical protein
MYKVKYDAYSKSSDGSIGNIIQFRDTYYTEHVIEVAKSIRYNERKYCINWSCLLHSFIPF